MGLEIKRLTDQNLGLKEEKIELIALKDKLQQ